MTYGWRRENESGFKSPRDKEWRYQAYARGQQIHRLERIIKRYREINKKQHERLRMTQQEYIEYQEERKDYRERRFHLFERDADTVKRVESTIYERYTAALENDDPRKAYFYGGAFHALKWLHDKYYSEPEQEEEEFFANSPQGAREFCLRRWQRKVLLQAIFCGFSFGLGGAIVGLLLVVIFKVLFS